MKRFAFFLVTLSLCIACLLAGCGASGTLAGSGAVVVGTWLAIASLAGLLVGCGGGGSAGSFQTGSAATTTSTTSQTTPTPTPLPAAKLGFLDAPAARAVSQRAVDALTTITPPPRVAVLDANGKVVTTATNAITVSLGANPNGATLTGTLTVNAVNGIATFDNLIISQAAAGFTLVASAEGLTSATTAQFIVNPLPLAFNTRRDFSAGDRPITTVGADFNGDGRGDVAVVAGKTASAGLLRVMLGQSDGTLSISQDLGLPQVGLLATGDFNGDGKADLVVTSDATDSKVDRGTLVFIGQGDGTFQAPINTNVTKQYYVTVGDVNNDGNADIVATSLAVPGLQVLLGQGNGSFNAPLNSPVPNPFALAMGDVDGDGMADVVVSTETGDLVLLKGNGNGTFRMPVTVTTGITAPALADLNGDGRLDIAADFTTGNRSGIAVLIGHGDGTFDARQNFGDIPLSYALRVSDLNGDGKPDIATSTIIGASAAVLLGNGNGTFGAAVNYDVGSSPFSLAITDVNGDGKPDVVTGNSVAETVSVLLGRGDGTLVDVPLTPQTSSPISVTQGDFNGDGHPDLAFVTYGQKKGSVLLGNGDGTFGVPWDFLTGGAIFVGTRDLNGDGKLDLVYSNAQEASVSVRLGHGDGTFGAPTNLSTAREPLSLAISDLNGDGNLDLAVPTRDVTAACIFLGNGNGSFQAAINVSNGDPDVRSRAALTGDLNGDQIPDLVLTTYDDQISILTGNGNGTFGAVVNLPIRAISGALADLNGDGKLDLAVSVYLPGGVSVLMGNGNGTFRAPQNYAIPDFAFNLALTDMNADGITDIVVVSRFARNAAILLGKGDGSFQSPEFFGSGALGLVVGDLNGDLKPDIVTSNSPGLYEMTTPGLNIIMHQ